ncbi:unnamed protein product [Rotaria sp. Silwood1]|nr:unnamed protein product [Rotaria sp. Silwood1]
MRKFPRYLSRYSKLSKDRIESLTNQNSPKLNNYTNPNACDSWVVVTTIFPPSEAVQKAARLDGWCVVVVADKKSSPSYYVSNIVYLSVEAQKKLVNHYKFVQLIPWNHFGRKNIGYLYAILQGAQYIFDLDDDNVLKQSHISPPKSVIEMTVSNCTVFNVYPTMGASKHPSWPRGFPLEKIKQECYWTQERREVHKDEVVIFQSLADNDPDVDAIYRMTLPLPLHFKSHTSVGIPPGVFVPYNAQASMHYRKSFWGLLLPITVHGRVSDIWRSYVTQRLLWEICGRIAFVSPWVTQFRNPHNYIQDFQAETDLYLKTGALIRVLLEWNGRSATLPGLIEELWIELYERDYVDKEDISLLQMWLDTLIHIGYKFPNIKRTFLNTTTSNNSCF